MLYSNPDNKNINNTAFYRAAISAESLKISSTLYTSRISTIFSLTFSQTYNSIMYTQMTTVRTNQYIFEEHKGKMKKSILPIMLDVFLCLPFQTVCTAQCYPKLTYGWSCLINKTTSSHTLCFQYAKPTWPGLCDCMVFHKYKLGPEAYCSSSSSSFCNTLSCFLAYTVKNIVAATDPQKPRTLKMICGAERKCCSCDASAKVRIKIPLHDIKIPISSIKHKDLCISRHNLQ